MAIKEIIGENMETVFSKLNISATLTYSGNNGYWQPLQVWEIDTKDYEKLCNITAKEWDALHCKDSWWRGSIGSNMGVPDDEFIINKVKIFVWRNKYKDDEAGRRWLEMDDVAQSKYNYSYGKYRQLWQPEKYDDILQYLCDCLGVSTENNVCSLVTDLAKYNNMTIAKLFKIYGEHKKEVTK